MPNYCCAYGCSNASTSQDSIDRNVSFHRFPLKNPILLKKWMLKIRRLHFTPSESTKICSDHFEDDCFTYQNFTNLRLLKEDAVPTLFVFSKKPYKRTKRHFGKKVDEQSELSTNNLKSSMPPVTSVYEEVQTEVHKLHYAKSDLKKEASLDDSEMSKALSFMSSSARSEKDDHPSLFPNSSIYMSNENLKRKNLEERHIRLEKEQFQRIVQQKFGNTNENPSQSSNAVTFLVPLDIFKQMHKDSLEQFHWNKNEVTALIALYQSEKCLYDKKHAHYYDLHERNKACERIKIILENMNFICTIPQIKNKIAELFSNYASEKAYKDRCIQAGQYTEDTYAPKMWCFGLLQFLDDYIEPRPEIETKEMEEEDQHKIQLLNSKDNHMDIKVETEKATNIKEHVSLKIDSSYSLNTGFDENAKDAKETSVCEEYLVDSDEIINEGNNREMEAIVKNSVSSNLNAIKIFSQDSVEKDDIFGEYIASEMKTLKNNPVLYIQTKQAVLDVLTSATFDLLNPE